MPDNISWSGLLDGAAGAALGGLVVGVTARWGISAARSAAIADRRRQIRTARDDRRSAAEIARQDRLHAADVAREDRLHDREMRLDERRQAAADRCIAALADLTRAILAEEAGATLAGRLLAIEQAEVTFRARLAPNDKRVDDALGELFTELFSRTPFSPAQEHRAGILAASSAMSAVLTGWVNNAAAMRTQPWTAKDIVKSWDEGRIWNPPREESK